MITDSEFISIYMRSITLTVGAAHRRIKLFASVWHLARPFFIFVFFIFVLFYFFNFSFFIFVFFYFCICLILYFCIFYFCIFPSIHVLCSGLGADMKYCAPEVSFVWIYCFVV